MIVALVVACAFFMETFTGTVITTALPAMARSFGSDPVRLSLGVTAYMLSLAIFIPLSGWVADRFGSRTVFRAAIGLFTLASVFCGLSDNLAELVLARVVQGVGGAMMVPVGRLVMFRSVDRSEYVRAMAWMTVPAFVGPIVGPPVGGFITTYLTWRWVFFLNVPIGLLGMVLVTYLIENYREPVARPLDWLGFVLSGVSLASILYSLDLAAHGSLGDVLGFAALLAAGLVIGALAVLHALRHPTPLLNLSLFRLPTFALSVWGGLFFRTSAGSIPFLLPVFLQVGLGMTAFVSGILIFADAIGNCAMNAVAPAALRRFGFRTVVVWNAVISAAGMAASSAFDANTPHAVIFAAFFFFGFMRSLQYNALSTLQYADIPAFELSGATSLAQMVQQLCSGTGVALGAVLLQLMLVLRGAGAESLGARDVRVVFIVIGLFALPSLLFFLRLGADAGAELVAPRAAARNSIAAPSADSS
ncbi:MAG TPA: MFS transporter [Stellaceae bacterium]|nr:MFS transporter [Stellaceae bacterium]